MAMRSQTQEGSGWSDLLPSLKDFENQKHSQDNTQQLIAQCALLRQQTVALARRGKPVPDWLWRALYAAALAAEREGHHD